MSVTPITQAAAALRTQILGAATDQLMAVLDAIGGMVQEPEAAAHPAKAANAAANPVKQAVDTARATTSSVQAGQAPLFADLERAVAAPRLPAPVKAAIAQVLALRTPASGPFTAQTIRQAVAQSGLFLESHLAALPEGQAPPPDLKAALLNLQRALAAVPPGEAAPRPQARPEPASQSVPTAQPPERAAAPASATIAPSPTPAVASTPPAAQAAGPLAPSLEPQLAALLPQVEPSLADLKATVATLQRALAAAPSGIAQPPVAAATAPPAGSAKPAATAPAPSAPAAHAEPPPVAPSPRPVAPAVVTLESPRPAVTRPELSLEAPRAAPLPGRPSPPVDLKTALLNLQRTPAAPSPSDPPTPSAVPPTATPSSGAASSGARTPPPVREAALAAQAPAPATLRADADPPAIATHLRQEVDQALARQTLHQLASLRDDGATGWMFELPIATPQGTAVAQFEIDRDGQARGDEETQAWRARFSIDIEPLGPVHVHLSLNGERTAVAIWAEREGTAEHLRSRGAELAQGMPADVVFRPGAPPRPTPGRGRFVDQAS